MSSCRQIHRPRPHRILRPRLHPRLLAAVLLPLTLWGCGEGDPGPASDALVLAGARIITGNPQVPVEDGVLVVEGDRIVAVGPRDEIQIPGGATVVDATGQTIMPAIINTHMHLASSREELISQLEHLAFYGVGAAASLGMDGAEVTFELRERPVPGAARILSAGRGITRPEPGRSEVPYWVDTEEEARAAVRELADRQVDLVKIWVDDRGGQYEKLDAELYGPIIDEAHRHELRVTAHIFSLEDAKRLLRAGIDAFAHGIRDRDVDDELMELWGERPHVVLVPNLPDPGVARDLSWLGGTVPADRLGEMQAGAVDRPQAREGFGIQARNLVRIHGAGLPVAFGTDGSNPWAAHQEMADMVLAGMEPADVVVAATRSSAELLDLEDTGTLEAGRIADFILLDGNPLDDITNTRRIADVYLRGVRVDREGISRRLLGGGS
jgi:imidazolonepropionase-like amidohydrolase